MMQNESCKRSPLDLQNRTSAEWSPRNAKSTLNFQQLTFERGSTECHGRSLHAFSNKVSNLAQFCRIQAACRVNGSETWEISEISVELLWLNPYPKNASKTEQIWDHFQVASSMSPSCDLGTCSMSWLDLDLDYVIEHPSDHWVWFAMFRHLTLESTVDVAVVQAVSSTALQKWQWKS